MSRTWYFECNAVYRQPAFGVVQFRQEVPSMGGISSGLIARLHQPIPILLNRIVERCWEWRLGVQTSGIQTLDQCVRDDTNPYIPIPFRTFFRTMKHVPYDLLTGTF